MWSKRQKRWLYVAIRNLGKCIILLSMEYIWYDCTIFFLPPSPRHQHFRGKFLGALSFIQKCPSKPCPPPPTFDAPVHEKTFAVRASTVSYRPKLHSRLRLVSLYLIKHCCNCLKNTGREDNLLTAGGGIIHHGEALDADEDLTPALENTVVVLWLQLIHPGLPCWWSKTYGSELLNKSLASLKPEISQALPRWWATINRWD
jgi:hypothetical protein